MNIKEHFNILFSDDNQNKIPFEVANEKEDGTFTIFFKEVAAEDKNYVERTLQACGFVPVPAIISTEIASYGGLEYSNSAEILEAHQEELEKAAVALASEEFEEEGEEEVPEEVTSEIATSIADRVLAKLQEAPTFKNRAEIALGSIDAISDDSRLKVIGNPEMMKFANKVFDMISPGEDKSNYAAFLYNFDDFLLMHQPNAGSAPVTDEEEDDSSIGESASVIPVTDKPNAPIELANFIKLFGDVNTASAFLTDFQSYLPAEIAKGKNARSALLSALMKGMSGEAGLAAVAAWESGDAAALQSSLDTVVKTVVARLDGGA